MFFKQGSNSVYTYDTMQLSKVGAGWSEWLSVSTSVDTIRSKIDILKVLKLASRELELLSKLGSFVLCQ